MRGPADLSALDDFDAIARRNLARANANAHAADAKEGRTVPRDAFRALRTEMHTRLVRSLKDNGSREPGAPAVVALVYARRGAEPSHEAY